MRTVYDIYTHRAYYEKKLRSSCSCYIQTIAEEEEEEEEEEE